MRTPDWRDVAIVLGAPLLLAVLGWRCHTDFYDDRTTDERLPEETTP